MYAPGVSELVQKSFDLTKPVLQAAQNKCFSFKKGRKYSGAS